MAQRQIQKIDNHDNVVTSFLNDAGEIHGLQTVHTRKGRLLEKRTYKDGALDGPVESYYDNGKLMYLCHFKAGLLEGDYKRWAPEGQLLSHARYIGGKREGLQESWYITGRPWQRYEAHADVYHGKYELFDGTGAALEEYNYKDGKLHGVCLRHIQGGQVRKMIYNCGTLVRATTENAEQITFDYDVVAAL